MKKIILLLFLASGLFAQDDQSVKMAGSLSADAQTAFQETYFQSDDNINITNSRKSPFLAGLMSLALPGAGEFYSESYIKAGVFFAVEVAAITFAVIYDGKGNDQTKVFENYAHQNWDVARYARWTIDNIAHLNEKIGSNVDPANYPNLFTDAGRTKVNWEVLNKLESDLGGWYSHKLERFGEQQYYEMIGKYPQFNPGWNDFNDADYPPDGFTYNANRKDKVTANFDYYSGLRGKANDYYNIASTAVVAVVVNHFISALDAAWSASRYNKNLQLNMSVEKQQVGFYQEFYPQLNMKLSF